MTPGVWIVLVAALGLATLLPFALWYRPTRRVRATLGENGYQEATIAVRGGYDPDTVVVARGRPVRLHFRREESAACSARVQLLAFGRIARLPRDEDVVVEFLPEESGTYKFTCQLGALRGHVVVE